MDNDRFARTIKNARLKKGYTQSQLADLLKVSNKTISKWETGRGYPDITLLAKITSILKLDYEELLQSNEYIIQKRKKKRKEKRMKKAGAWKGFFFILPSLCGLILFYLLPYSYFHMLQTIKHLSLP